MYSYVLLQVSSECCSIKDHWARSAVRSQFIAVQVMGPVMRLMSFSRISGSTNRAELFEAIIGTDELEKEGD